MICQILRISLKKYNKSRPRCYFWSSPSQWRSSPGQPVLCNVTNVLGQMATLKKFIDELIPLLIDMYFFSSKCLLQSSRQWLIFLILKRNRDSLDCSSFRSISISVDNCGVKVLETLLEAILPSVISCDLIKIIKHIPFFLSYSFNII